MTWTIDAASPQNGRIAIVTGANIGVGFETARFLAHKGCQVVLACRSAAKAEVARGRMLAENAAADVRCMTLDLASLASVRRFAEQFIHEYPRLDLLINNAGVMFPPYSLTEDGFENQFASNYVGHFVLTGLLLPVLERTEKSRIVPVSSVAHRAGDICFDDLQFKRACNAARAYRQSKLACLLFGYELQRRLVANGYQAIAVAAHPGVSHTNLGRHMNVVARVMFSLFGSPPAAGAAPLLYAALNPALTGGEYVGPRGMGEWRGEPGIVDSTARSKDPALAAKLWNLTEQLTGFRYLSNTASV